MRGKFLKNFLEIFLRKNGGGVILGELSSRKNENGAVTRFKIFAEMNFCLTEIEMEGAEKIFVI